MNCCGNNGGGFGNIFGGDSCNWLFMLLLLQCFCGNSGSTYNSGCGCGCDCGCRRDICD